MKTRRGMLVLAGVVLAGSLCLAPVRALPEPSEAELAHNRQLLERWRAEPERLARLRQDLLAFQRLSLEDQVRIRQLDRDLQEEDSLTQARLWQVMERYAAWLDKLPADQRREIQAAPTSSERLKVVRRLREQEWIDRLPAAVRKQLRDLPLDQRPARIRELRQDERRRREEWLAAVRPGNPVSSKPPPGSPPLIPERWLREFALKELTAEDRARLKLSISDPESRERLKQEWIRRHPKEWQRMLQAEERQKQRRQAPGGK